MNNQYKDLEANYQKNKKIQKKILRGFPQGAEVISAYKNKSKVLKKQKEYVPFKKLTLPKVEK